MDTIDATAQPQPTEPALVRWEVIYEYDGCPGAAFTSRECGKAEIMAPEDREEAKKVAIAYLDGLKVGGHSIRASGHGLRRIS